VGDERRLNTAAEKRLTRPYLLRGWNSGILRLNNWVFFEACNSRNGFTELKSVAMRTVRVEEDV
jgi:hypothetical protein